MFSNQLKIKRRLTTIVTTTKQINTTNNKTYANNDAIPINESNFTLKFY